MQTVARELSSLLDCIGPEQIGASSRHRALIRSDHHAPSSVLFSCHAHWTTRRTANAMREGGPAHQTLRHRGQAPAYHRPIDLTRCIPGKVIMHRDHLVLEPSASTGPTTEIDQSSIHRVSFYADCVEIMHGAGEKTLLCSDTIELLDLKFEVYYGRRCGFGFNQA